MRKALQQLAVFIYLSRMQFTVGNKKYYHWIFLAAFLLATGVRAQTEDFGVWASVAVSHKFSQKFSMAVEEQVRTYQNSTAIDQYFTEGSLEYILSKKFRVAGGYRFINNNEQTHFSKRHRVFGDLSYRTKLNSLQFILRTRIQGQKENIRSSETGSITEWHNRNKLTVKLDLRRKYTPYSSAEMMILLKSPNSDANYIEKWRYIFGIEFEFNRVHMLDLFYLIQRERMVDMPLTYYAVGIGYVFTF